MAPQAPEREPFFIRWQGKMSYINEALKKAQRDKDAGYPGYMHSIKKSGSKNSLFDKKFIFSIVVILSLTVLLFYSMLGGRAEHDIGNNKETSVDIPVSKNQNTVKNMPVIERDNLPRGDTTEQENNSFNKKDEIETLYMQAVSFFKENKIQQAKDIYKEILLQDPGHINSLNDMGVLFLQEGRYADAVNYLEKAVRLKPNFANPFYNLACAYSLQNEKEKGMAYLLMAIEVDEKVKGWAKEDPDLKNLKDYAEFKIITN